MTREAGRRLGDALRECGYTVDGIRDAIGPEASAALDRDEPAAVRLALGSRDDVLATLIRVLLLDEALDGLPPGGPWPELFELDLLTGHDGRVVAAHDLRPYDESWYVVSDLTTGGLAPDHVLGVGGASLTLATITPRAAVGRALDVGTGSGVQALHLCGHADTVTATDVSPRALRLAALTAALSGVSFELREGTLLAPVVGETYDLVVSNPPFVVSPTLRYTYRDGGFAADALGATLVGGLTDVLAPGGTGVVLANWLHVAGEDWHERVAAWIPGGVDAWVAQREVLDPAAYVGTWLRDAGPLDTVVQEQRYHEWLQGLLELGVEGVGFGWIVLGRRETNAPPRIEDVSGAVRLPHGDEVGALLDVRARPELADARALLAARLCPAPSLRITASETYDGGWGRTPALVDLATGWRPPATVDDVTASLLRALDGSRPLADATDEVAAAYDLDPDDVRAGALPLVRELLETAHLHLPTRT